MTTRAAKYHQGKHNKENGIVKIYERLYRIKGKESPRPRGLFTMDLRLFACEVLERWMKNRIQMTLFTPPGHTRI